MHDRQPNNKRVSAFLDDLQASGRRCFRSEEVAAAVGGSPAAIWAALRRLKQKGRLVSPRRDFYVIVPLEYRVAGSPPASWFIDELMAYLERPYYVGLLTAAMFHGAAHQQPQVFQVITNVPTRPVQLGRVRIEFHRNRNIDRVPVQRLKTETGYMRVSTPEATAVDLVRYPGAAGHLNNVATVLTELAEVMDPARLREVAADARVPDIQRLGYLLEQVGFPELAEPLAELLAARRRRLVLLCPGREANGQSRVDPWHVVPNEELEPDL